MTFNEKLNLSRDLSHEEKYGRIIDALGFENVKKCLPFTEDEIRKAYAEDKHLNTLPLKKWSLAAGFETNGSDVKHVGSPLTFLYSAIGVNAYSCSEGVCILKECARRSIA